MAVVRIIKVVQNGDQSQEVHTRAAYLAIRSKA